MRVVKAFVLGVCVVAAALAAPWGDAGPRPGPAVAPARADLAEAVLAMVLENAASQGNVLSQPVTLCEACLAAHLGLPEAAIKARCGRACGLR